MTNTWNRLRSSRRTRLVAAALAGILLGGLLGWFAFDSPWPAADAAGCAPRPNTVTVAAGYDESVDQQRRRVVEEWNYEGYRAAFTQISPIADDERVEMAASAQRGGCPFDVLILDIAHVAEFAESGAIAELTLPAGRAFLGRTVKAGAYQGRQYGVPFAADVPLLYVRGEADDLIQRTWGRSPLPAAPASGDVIVQLFDYEGGSVNLMEAVGAANLARFGESVPDGPALRRTLQPGLGRWARLYQENKGMRASAGFTERDSIEEFRLSPGPVVMRNWPSAFGALAAADRFRARDGRLSFTIEPVPGGVLGGAVLAISSGLDPVRAEAARSLIDHLTRPKTQAELFACGSFAPVVADAYDLDDYARLGFATADNCLNLGDSPDAASYRADFRTLANTVRTAIGTSDSRPPIPHYSRFSEVFRRCARAIVTGEVAQSDDAYYRTFSAALTRAITGRLTEGAPSATCR